MNKKEIDVIQKNKLEIIGKKAAKHAVNALSKMVKQYVEFSSISADIIKIEEASEIIKDKEKNVVGIYFNLLEEIQGISLILFPMKSSFTLIDLFSHKKLGSTNKIKSDYDKSILMETGNIVLGAFLTIFSAMTDVLMIGSIPHLAEDTAGSIFNSVVAEMGIKSDFLLTLEVVFRTRTELIKGQIFVFVDIKSSKKIIEALI